MKPIGVIFLCAAGLVSCAPAAMKLMENQEVIGNNLRTGSNIEAKAYTFPKRIQDFSIDTSSHLITVELRELTSSRHLENVGKVAVFDVAKGQSRWVKNVRYPVSRIFLQDTMIIQQFANHCVRLDYKNGDKFWESSHKLFYSPDSRVGFAYKSGWGNTVEGIDLSTGIKLFSRELNEEAGIDQILNWNDSTLLLVSGGLHSFHVRYGYGFDYDAVTTQKNYLKSAAINLIGLSALILTGSGFVYYGHDTYSNLVSKVLVDHDQLFFASKDQLVKIGADGQVVWKTELPQDKASMSRLYLRKGVLYMINLGRAYYNGVQEEYGKPFLAAFDANTGKSLYVNYLGEDKSYINDYKVTGNDILILFRDGISKYRLSDGTLLGEKIMDPETYGDGLSFVGEQVYNASQSNYVSMVKSDTSHYYVFSPELNIWRLNQDMSVNNQVKSDSLYTVFRVNSEEIWMHRAGNMKVLDKGGKEIASLKMQKSAILLGNKMYWSEGNRLYEMDINEIRKASHAIDKHTPPAQN